MALVLANRVQETTTTTGTGTVTLAGAVAGFQSFAVIGDANTTYYTITSGNDWEVGIGTYTSSGTTLARTTVLSSSAGGTTKITLAGTSTVFVTYPSEEAILDGYGLLPIANGGTNATTAADALTSLGAYPASNPSGYTSNTGTVTSVGGTGTVNGITLTGTVTTSGNLTLGGTLSGVDLTTQVTGTLPVANGGTGVTTSTGTGNVVLSASPTFTGTVTTATADLLGSVRGNVTTVAASAVDCSLGNYFTKTASGALTWTFTNAPSTRSYSFLLELTNGGTGAQTWPASVDWPSGTAPTLTASGVDVLGFITDDGGTIWRGVMLMKDSK